MNAVEQKADLETWLGFPFSTDDEGQLVVHGRTRDIVVRRLTVFQVDERRFDDPDDAIFAACWLLTEGPPT